MYDFPTVLYSEFRRKVRLQAGLYQMLKIMPGLLSSRNRMRFHFVSGKYGRIVIPYCMIAVALATIGLPPYWRAAAFWGQVLFYGLAAVDGMVSDNVGLKKLTSPIRTFVVLMAASLAAVQVYFVQPTSLWKDVSYRASIAEQSPSSDPKVPSGTGV
jgi:hypothetical protein